MAPNTFVLWSTFTCRDWKVPLPSHMTQDEKGFQTRAPVYLLPLNTHPTHTCCLQGCLGVSLASPQSPLLDPLRSVAMEWTQESQQVSNATQLQELAVPRSIPQPKECGRHSSASCYRRQQEGVGPCPRVKSGAPTFLARSPS